MRGPDRPALTAGPGARPMRLSPALVLRMTRPGFLSITAVAALVGIASAWSIGCRPVPTTMIATIALAVLAHAAANVINDYHDALNGADDANDAGIWPFTGGSRLIQTQTTTVALTGCVAAGLFALVAVAGLAIALRHEPLLLPIGAAGLLLGWGYSAPPLRLMSRGLGELAVAIAWSLILVGSAASACRQAVPPALACAPGFGLMLANILLINEFPDARADAAVGKATLVVRLGARPAARLYLALAVLAHLLAGLMVLLGALPWQALAAWIALPIATLAARALIRDHAAPARLRAPIVATIAAAHLYGIGLALGLSFAGPGGLH
ncbi:MAG: prenyltransferase [Burkholderiaceae bacterium]